LPPLPASPATEPVGRLELCHGRDSENWIGDPVSPPQYRVHTRASAASRTHHLSPSLQTQNARANGANDKGQPSRSDTVERRECDCRVSGNAALPQERHQAGILGTEPTGIMES